MTDIGMKFEMNKKDLRIKELEIELSALRSVMNETLRENLSLQAQLIQLLTRVEMLERGITLEEGD